MNNLYYRDETTKLYVGDALTVLRKLADDSVHCVVTSPPYWGLRDYGTATWVGGSSECVHTLGVTPRQLRTPKAAYAATTSARRKKRCRRCGALCRDPQYGHESTPEEYVNKIREVFTELWRTLVPDGTVWLNVGDTFGSNGDKSLNGIPWRVAFALQEDGWIIRNAIVWHKPNAMPESIRDRLSCRYEMLFMFVKQQNYFFDLDVIRQPHTEDRPRRRKIHRGGAKDNTIKIYWTPQQKGKNPGDLWSIATRPLREAHCAPFPIDLPLRCIAAGCPENGLVLDPFSGAGTTGLAARQLGRRFQGVDLRADYHDIFLRRLAAVHTSAPPEAA